MPVDSLSFWPEEDGDLEDVFSGAGSGCTCRDQIRVIYSTDEAERVRAGDCTVCGKRLPKGGGPLHILVLPELRGRQT